MRVIEINGFGGVDKLRLSTRKAPSEIELSPGEVIIKVEAFGINRLDVFQRQGFYPPPAHVTDIPGLEVSGTIVSGNFSFDCGLGLCVGDKVCALVAGGGYAEYVVAPHYSVPSVAKRFELRGSSCTARGLFYHLAKPF